MTDFKQAAASASNELFQYIIKHKGDANLYGAAEIITKHHAEIEEAFGLLCELARATRLFVMAHDNLETEKALNRSNYNTDIEDIAYIGKAVAGTELRDLLAAPRIAALLAEKG